jgi:hypothetical protein
MPAEDSVREQLRRKMQQLTEHAASHDGEVPSAAMDELNRLARLVEVREKMFAPNVARWRVAALMLGTLVLVSVMLFNHVGETEVELELVASEIGFTIPRPQVVTDIAQLAELRATGLRDMQFSDAALAQWTAQPAVERTAVRLAVLERDKTAGTVTLAPLALPARTGIRVREHPSLAGLGVLLDHASVPLRVTVNGPVQVGLPNTEARAFDFQTPRSLILETDSSDTSLQLLFAPGAVAPFASQLAVEKLALSRIDEFESPDGTTAHEVSTILSGTIWFEALNGQARKLRPSELLRFDSTAGVIRTIELQNRHLAMQFRGTVRGMRSGWGDAPVNLMPTWLEWLRARHGLSLLWGTTLYLSGLAAAVLRWWRVRL